MPTFRVGCPFTTFANRRHCYPKRRTWPGKGGFVTGKRGYLRGKGGFGAGKWGLMLSVVVCR